jgi:hypothetical protein
MKLPRAPKKSPTAFPVVVGLFQIATTTNAITSQTRICLTLIFTYETSGATARGLRPSPNLLVGADRGNESTQAGGHVIELGHRLLQHSSDRFDLVDAPHHLAPEGQ